MDNENELHIVTEVGTFGELDINDPSKKRVLNKKELDELIEKSIKENASN